MTEIKCHSCDGELIQKSRWRLFIVGTVMSALIVFAVFFPYLWVPGIVFALAGIYLIVWATLGRGRWCRQCKTFRS